MTKRMAEIQVHREYAGAKEQSFSDRADMACLQVVRWAGALTELIIACWALKFGVSAIARSDLLHGTAYIALGSLLLALGALLMVAPSRHAAKQDYEARKACYFLGVALPAAMGCCWLVAAIVAAFSGAPQVAFGECVFMAVVFGVFAVALSGLESHDPILREVQDEQSSENLFQERSET